jgi:hypothetical protein
LSTGILARTPEFGVVVAASCRGGELRDGGGIVGSSGARDEWDLVVPSDGASLLAEFRRHGVEPGQRVHLRVVTDVAGPSTEPSPDDAPVAPGGDAVPTDALLSLIGVFEGPPDLAERHDDYVKERMRRRLSDPE